MDYGMVLAAAGTVAMCGTLLQNSAGLGSQLIKLRGADAGKIEGLSLPTYALLACGQFNWCVYGVLADNPFIWLPNGMGCAMAILIVRRVRRLRSRGFVRDRQRAAS